LVLASPGIYVLSEDTLTDPGQALVVVPNQYPNLSRASELIAPLTYITTRAERARLQSAAQPKREVDKFWLDIAGSRDNARRLIAAYYANVEYANAWFTDYREGFKTDRGMVFIIFGKPGKVLRTGSTEEWHYDERGNTPDLQFTFERRPAPMGSPCWQLRRSPDYDRFWYTVVDQWRKGVIRR
jgi:GWxTD domain-containing protein